MLINVLCGILGGIVGGVIIFAGNIFLYWFETRLRNNKQKELVDALKDAVKASKGNSGALAKILQFKGSPTSSNPDKLN